MDVPSREGNNYAVVMIDEATGWITGFFVKVRSDITHELAEHIKRVRADPELRCPDFCKKFLGDPAGEWHRENAVFMQLMTELGVEIPTLPTSTQSDHRQASHAENAVGLSKSKMQAIMLDTKLECSMWQVVMQYAWTVHNLYPLARNASRNGQGPRPLTQISSGNVDESECNRRIEYAV
jgi:hypothetical protein